MNENDFQAALKAELARVYFEEFARFVESTFHTIILTLSLFRSQDNEVDWEEGSGSGDYYYYYYDDYFEWRPHPYYEQYNEVTCEEVTSKSRSAVVEWGGVG